MKKKYTIYVEETVIDEIKKIANENDFKLGILIQRILEKWMEENKK